MGYPQPTTKFGAKLKITNAQSVVGLQADAVQTFMSTMTINLAKFAVFCAITATVV